MGKQLTVFGSLEMVLECFLLELVLEVLEKMMIKIVWEEVFESKWAEYLGVSSVELANGRGPVCLRDVNRVSGGNIRYHEACIWERVIHMGCAWSSRGDVLGGWGRRFPWREREDRILKWEKESCMERGMRCGCSLEGIRVIRFFWAWSLWLLSLGCSWEKKKRLPCGVKGVDKETWAHGYLPHGHLIFI